MKKQVAFTRILSNLEIGSRCKIQLTDGSVANCSRVIAFDDNKIETKNTIYVKYQTQSVSPDAYNNTTPTPQYPQSQPYQQPQQVQNQPYNQPIQQNPYQQPQYQQSPQYQQPIQQQVQQQNTPYQPQPQQYPINEQNLQGQLYQDRNSSLKKPPKTEETVYNNRINKAKGLVIIGDIDDDNNG